MRTMLRVTPDLETANQVITEMGQIIGALQEQIKPEAAYFLTEGGKRTALFFFDL